ncbi:MAG: hypothetical protein OXI01_00970 [Albidovulum sp.]|nr:hypothetical protein [Albidovulum sp.]
MMIEFVEYDDKTDLGEHIKLVQRLAEQDRFEIVVAPNGTGFNLATAPICCGCGFPMIAVSAINGKTGEMANRYPDLFISLGSAFAFGVARETSWSSGAMPPPKAAMSLS